MGTISKNTKEEDDNKFAPNLKAATTCYRTLICLLLKYNQSISIAMNQDVSNQQSNTNSNSYLVLLNIWKTAIEMQANTMYTETVFILPMTESVASNVSNHCDLLLHDIVPLFQISTNTNELKQYRCQTKEEDEEKEQKEQ